MLHLSPALIMKRGRLHAIGDPSGRPPAHCIFDLTGRPSRTSAHGGVLRRGAIEEGSMAEVDAEQERELAVLAALYILGSRVL